MASNTNYKWIVAPGLMCRRIRTYHSSNQEDETLVLGPISPRSATTLARGADMAPTFQSMQSTQDPRVDIDPRLQNPRMSTISQLAIKYAARRDCTGP
eukprot:8261022-Alexandrium_andersonii.AAC.1